MDNVHRSTASLIVPQVGSTAPQSKGSGINPHLCLSDITSSFCFRGVESTSFLIVGQRGCGLPH